MVIRLLLSRTSQQRTCARRIGTCQHQSSQCSACLGLAVLLLCTLQWSSQSLRGKLQSSHCCWTLGQNRTCQQGSQCTRAEQTDPGTCLLDMGCMPLAAADDHLLMCLGMCQQPMHSRRCNTGLQGSPCTQGKTQSAGSALSHSCTLLLQRRYPLHSR